MLLHSMIELSGKKLKELSLMPQGITEPQVTEIIYKKVFNSLPLPLSHRLSIPKL